MMNETKDPVEAVSELLAAIKSFCGTGLEVANWHRNGDLIEFDFLIEENMNADWDEMGEALTQATENKAKANRLDEVVHLCEAAKKNATSLDKYFFIREILKIAKGESSG